MATIPFHLVDVFSTTPYKGNPLAIIDTVDHPLTDDQMKVIARQFNLSETTFLLAPTTQDADFRLRSFLPNGVEVFGAGHNILGVWWFLAHDGRLDFSAREPSATLERCQEFTFHQELGQEITPVIIVRTRTSALNMFEYSVSLRQAPPKAHAYDEDLQALATVIGIPKEQIGFSNNSQTTLKPRVMSTSKARYLFVPVSSEGALGAVKIQKDKLLEKLLAVDKSLYGIYLFTPLSSANESTLAYKARFFSPGMSNEDPATGSAAGPLSAYLYQHGELPLHQGHGRILVYQGQYLGRDCLMDVRLRSGDVSLGECAVEIIGGGAWVGGGKVQVPNETVRF